MTIATTRHPITPPAPAPDTQPAAGPATNATTWQRWALAGLLTATAALYLWGLDRNGWANSFYSAAVQAGSTDWTAFFFGSSDAANSITVDKPPLSLWVMELSARVFGLNSWSLLVPQSLMGVASVWLLYLGVRRWYGVNAGLLAGALLAVTPAATLMFRFNNPDALLVLLLVAAAYATIRATEKASARWLALAGVLVGLGFMTKMLQALLVVPALAITYFVAAPSSWLRRLRDLVVAGLAMVIAGGWWVAVVELVPGSTRPYMGGSQTDSVVELILGYNGLGRITGNEVGSVGGGGGGPAGGGFGGTSGLGRLLDPSWAGYIAWFLPAAAILTIAALWFTRRRPRTDRLRAGALLWGLWALVTWVVFSLSSGIIHEYYSIALAPALAALVALGISILWWERAQLPARLTLAAALISAGITAGWIMTLAGGGYATAGLLIAAVIGVAAVIVGSPFAHSGTTGRIALGLASVALLVGPLVFSVHTALGTSSGSLPSVSPVLKGTSAPGGPGPMGAPPGQGGGMGGLLNAPTVGSELVAVLTANADQYTWIAAGIGSQATAGYQLATGYPVMPVGGFNGTDPSPTLEEFQEYVKAGKIHYFIGGSGFGPGAGSSSQSSQISEWVQQTFESETVDGVTLYDLTVGTG